MELKKELETKDLILGKAKQEDLHSIYNNYWCSEIPAKFMLWVPQKNLEEAQERLDKTITIALVNPHRPTKPLASIHCSPRRIEVTISLNKNIPIPIGKTTVAITL